MKSTNTILGFILCGILFFQNCSKTTEFAVSSKSAANLNSIEQSDTTTPIAPPTTEEEQPADPRECAAGSIEWTVGSRKCTAVYPRLTYRPEPYELSDTTAPTTGKASFACTEAGVLSPVSTLAKTCVTASTEPTGPRARLSQSTYFIGENNTFVFYTGGTVSEDVYVCYSVSIYGCQTDAEYKAVPKPSSPSSPTNELVLTVNIYGMPKSELDFDRYTFKSVKKDATGKFVSIGSDTAYLRFTNSADSYPGSSTFSGTGGREFKITCGNREMNQPAGYSSYYGNAEAELQCYFKIN